MRKRLAIALDADDLVVAARLAASVSEYFGIAKVGLELYTAAGPEAVEAMIDAGFEVFVDLKLHDIPTTVERAARVVGGLGARYLTLHAQGGPEMVRAGVEGLTGGAAAGGFGEPVALGVTVLTSDPVHSAALIEERLEVAVSAGCRGVVCSAADLDTVGRWQSGSGGGANPLLTVVPGIRPAGVGAGDQRRVATPEAALRAGAGVLVVGRAVTGAVDPVLAARAIAKGAAEVLGGQGGG